MLGMFREMHKKSKAFRSFLFTYLIFLLIIFCIGVISIWISSSIIEEQVGKVYLGSLKQVRTASDHVVSKIAASASELMFNNRINTLKMAGLSNTPQDVITLADLQEDIHNAMIVNPAISSIAVYFPAGEYVLDNMACYRKNYLEEWCIRNYNKSLAGMKKLAFDQYTVGKLVALPDPNTGNVNYLYIKTLGNYPESVKQPVLMITLHGSVFASVMKEYESSIGAQVYLVTQDGLVLDSSFKPAKNAYEILYLSETLKKESAVSGPDNSFVIYMPSPAMYTDYVSIIPNSLYFGDVNRVIKALLFILTVFIGIGLLMAVFFSRRNSTPIEKMTKLLRSSGQQSADTGNEYEYIEHMLYNLISENKLLGKNLDTQKREMKDNFLMRLTKGNVLYSSVHDALEYYNIELDGDLFIATAYIIENAGPHFSGGNTDEQQDLLFYSIRNSAEEITLDKYDCFVCKVDDKIICVASSSEDEASFFENAVNLAKTEVDFFAKKLNVEIVASVSRAYPGIDSISHAYVESVDCLEYRTATGKLDRVIYMMPDSKGEHEFVYLVGSEKYFVDCIKSADYRRAKLYLDDIIEQCKKMRSLPLIKVKMSGLISSVLTALSEFGAEADTAFFNTLDPAKHLLEAKSIDELADRIRSILDRIITHTEEKTVAITGSSINNIIHYLNENYADPLLSISSLADKFSINRSYLSQKFKANTGMSPLGHLNKIRIEKAKELIRSGSSNFAEIAAACGYYDSHALNVAFKKHEGMSPTKYRVLWNTRTEFSSSH